MSSLAQTKQAPKPKTFTLDQSRKKIWIAKPIPSWQGGEPEHLASEVRDFLYGPQGKEVSVLIFDSWSTYADQVLNRACEVTTTDRHKASRTFGDFIAADKVQYLYTQGVIGRGLFDLSNTGKRSVHLSHVATLTEDAVIGDGAAREKVQRAVAHGFMSAGRAQIKVLTKFFSPGLVHLAVERKGYGANQASEHTAWLDKHGTPPYFAKWQNPEAPASMSIEGKAGCEAFWHMSLKTSPNAFNIGIYGEAGDGKTTLALTLWPEFWTKDEGVVLYVAVDPSSEALPTAWPGTVR